jgi:hypothetical protein
MMTLFVVSSLAFKGFAVCARMALAASSCFLTFFPLDRGWISMQSDVKHANRDGFCTAGM